MRKGIPRVNKLIKFPETLFDKIEGFRNAPENLNEEGKAMSFCPAVYMLIRKGLAYNQLEAEGKVPDYKDIYKLGPNEIPEEE